MSKFRKFICRLIQRKSDTSDLSNLEEDVMQERHRVTQEILGKIDI